MKQIKEADNVGTFDDVVPDKVKMYRRYLHDIIVQRTRVMINTSYRLYFVCIVFFCNIVCFNLQMSAALLVYIVIFLFLDFFNTHPRLTPVNLQRRSHTCRLD